MRTDRLKNRPLDTCVRTMERIMERDMTAAAFDEYLRQDPVLAALAGKLKPGVDGDLLINNVATQDPRLAVAVLQTFIDSGEVGLIGKLVLKIKLFLAAEKAGREKDKKGKKRERDEAKAQRLQEAMMKEQEGGRGGDGRGGGGGSPPFYAFMAIRA